MACIRKLGPAVVAVMGLAAGALGLGVGLSLTDSGLLTLAFLILCPLLIAVEVIPGWLESLHNLKDAAAEVGEKPTPAQEAEG